MHYPTGKQKIEITALIVLLFGLWAGVALAQSPSDADSPQQRRGAFGGVERGVYKSRITPHWFQNDTRFWYCNDLRGAAREFIVMDAEKGTRATAFDHARLAAGLSRAASREFKADHLPFSNIEFIDQGKAVKFEAAD